MKKNLLLVGIVVFLTSCGSILGPQSQRPVVNYEIVDNSIIESQLPSCNPSLENKVLFVSPTRAALPYDTYKMYYSDKEYQLNSYNYSQWAIAAPELINQNLMKRLVLSCSFKDVVLSTTITNANYRLVTNLVTLRHEINKSKDTGVAHLVVASELIDLKKNRLIGNFIYDKSVPTDMSVTDYVKATSYLVSDFDAQMLNWIQQNT